MGSRGRSRPRYPPHVELTPAKIGIILALVATVAGLGGWAWATATMEGRLANVRNEARRIGYARGGHLPTDAQVREQVEAIAAAHQVTLDALSVTSREEAGLGGIAARVPQLAGTLSGRVRVYAIRGTGRTRSLVFSRTEPIEIELSLRAAVEQQAPGRARGPGVEASGASVDVHGGLRPEEIDVRSRRGM